MRKYNTVIIDGKKFNDAIQTYCRRNGVSINKVCSAQNISNHFMSNGIATYKRKHPESGNGYIELTANTYDLLCRAFLLSPELYVVTDDNNKVEEKPAAQPQKPDDKTLVAYIRMVNERLIDIEKLQAEQNDLLRQLVELWKK